MWGRMQCRAIGGLLASLLALSTHGLGVVPAASGKLKIEGSVVDERNKGVVGAEVRLYRGDGYLVGSGTTASEGRYTVEFDSGDVITTVRYDLTGWNVATIGELSGQMSHSINKVLSREGAELSEYQRRELGVAIARIYEIDRHNGVSNDEFVRRYRTGLGEIVSQYALATQGTAAGVRLDRQLVLAYWGASSETSAGAGGEAKPAPNLLTPLRQRTSLISVLGKTSDEIVAVLGQPESMEKSAKKTVYVYDAFKVTFVEDKVVELARKE